MATHVARVPGRGAAIAAGVIALGTTALYLVLIAGQGDTDTGIVATVTVVLVALGTTALAAGLLAGWSARTRMIVLGATSGGLLAAGVLALLSVGLPLLIAGVCAAFAWGRIASASRPVPAGAPMLSALAGIGTGAAVIAAILAG